MKYWLLSALDISVKDYHEGTIKYRWLYSPLMKYLKKNDTVFLPVKCIFKQWYNRKKSSGLAMSNGNRKCV